MEALLLLVAVVAAFYFILLRPVMKQQRARRTDISSLHVGDEVLTTGGFYATVRALRTTDEGPMEIDLEVAPGVTLRATAEAILRVTHSAGPTGEASEDEAAARDETLDASGRG